MTEEKITPEERLLKIIEGPLQQVRARPAGLLKQASAVLPHDLINRLKKIRLDKNIFKKINPDIINKIAVSFCGAFTVFLIFDLAHNGFTVNSRFERFKAAAEISGAQEIITPELDMDINSMISANSGNSMFSVKPRKAETAAAVASADAEMPLPDIKLVGIIWSQTPQAMLEDTKENKTYLLNAGDKVGNITIKAITQDKVIVTNGQAERELR